MKTKNLNLELKYAQQSPTDCQQQAGVISGYASLFHERDQGGDRIAPGAFAESLKTRGVKMLWQHDQTQPIGIWEEVVEDSKGLFVRGKILTDIAAGREALALIKSGAVTGLSIGYQTVQASKAGPDRVLHQVELWEVSLVTFPMQTQANITAVHDETTDYVTLLQAELASLKEILNH